jgi:hypothetical protein
LAIDSDVSLFDICKPALSSAALFILSPELSRSYAVDSVLLNTGFDDNDCVNDETVNINFLAMKNSYI